MGLLTDARELLLGGACPGCGAPGWALCPSCTAALQARPHLVGRPWEDLPVTYATAPYEPVAHAVVVAAKERGVWRACEDLGSSLARAVAAALLHVGAEPPVVLVPVPSSAAAVRRRGLDVTARTARACAQCLVEAGIVAHVSTCLVQRRGTRDQTELDAAGRRANLADAIVAVRPPGEGAVVVVDDVVTTGASLLAATTALRRVGVDVAACACVAARGWR